MNGKFYLMIVFLLVGQHLLAQDSTMQIAFTKKEHSKARLFVLHPKNKVVIKLIDNQKIKGRFSSVDSQNIYVYYKSYDSFGYYTGNYIDTVALDSISYLKRPSVGKNIFGGYVLFSGIYGTGFGIAGVVASSYSTYGFILIPLFASVIVSSVPLIYLGAVLLRQDRFIANENHYFIYKVPNKDSKYISRVNRAARHHATE